MFLGSFAIDDTCTFYVNSHTPGTGAAVDADAVPGYRVYEDETGTPILTGSMALLDDANTVGFYSEQITLSAANGFELGKSYCIRITVVVGGVTGTALRFLQMGSKVDLRMVGGSVQSQADLKDFADDGYDPSTNKVQGVVLTDTLTTYTGNTVQTGDSFARLGAPAGASVSADVAAVKAETATILADTNDLQTRVPAALVSGRMDSSVGAMAANVLTAAATAADFTTEIQVGLATSAAVVTLQTSVDDLPTNAELATALAAADDAVLAAIAALNNLSAAQVNAEVVDALAVDTYAEPTGVPAATTTLAGKLSRLHQALRNRIDVDSNTGKKQFFDDAGAALWEKDFTDAAGVFSEGEGNAP